jgi:hypothetical protein
VTPVALILMIEAQLRRGENAVEEKTKERDQHLGEGPDSNGQQMEKRSLPEVVIAGDQ